MVALPLFENVGIMFQEVHEHFKTLINLFSVKVV